MDKKHLISLASYNWVDKGKLIWTEVSDDCGNNILNGPFILLDNWCQPLFGQGTQQLSAGHGVKYLNTETGERSTATHNSMLFTSYFAMKEDCK